MQHSDRIEIRLLGELEVLRGEQRVDFPPSKKTRALLAYLVATGRSHRRERLCSLLWDVTDDPRGALRWSLSRLRPLVNGAEQQRLVADRDAVRFDALDATVDVSEFKRLVGDDLGAQPIERLEQWANQYAGTFLEGLELTEFHDFQAWCIAERENVRRLRVRLLEALLSRLKDDPERCLSHAVALTQADPLNARARAELIRLSCHLGRHAEAEEHYRAGQRLFKELGGDEPQELTAARGHLQRRKPPAEHEAAPQSSSRQALLIGRDEAPVSTLQIGDLPPLVGRTELLASVRAELADCVTERRQRSLLLLGEPGVGKSRLLAEIRADAYQRGGTVIDGRAYEAEVGRPYGPWIDALRRLARQRLPSAAQQQLAGLAPRLSEPDAGASRDALLAAVSGFVAERARSSGPVYLLLDDVQWADEASVALLHYVLRININVPLFTVLAAREGELGDNVPMNRVVRTLHRERRVRDVSLTRLGPEETAELVRRVVPEAATGDVFTQSAGNPLFALEIARAAALGHNDAQASLVSVVRERIERLPQGAADVMRWGAVLGSVFTIDRLEPLVAMDAEELARSLEILERHALLSSDEQAYAFCHDVVRDAVYSELSPPRRRLMHRSVARALEPLVQRDETVAGELAHHAALAGEAALAVRACVASAKRCLRLFANRQADTLCRRGLFHAAELDEEERVVATLELLRIQCRARRPADLGSLIEQLEELAQRAMDFGRLDHARGAFHTISHLRWEQGAWALAKRNSLAAELLSRSGDDNERVVAMSEAARCLAVLGRDFVDAEAMLLEAKTLARRVGREPVQLADGIGLLRLQQGQLDDAAEHFERARLTARREGERAAEFEAWAHLVMLDLERERYAEALEHAQQLVPLAEKLREGSELPFARALCGLCRHALQHPSAVAELTAGLSELRLADAKYRLAFVLNRAAWLDVQREETERATQRAAEALEVATVLEHPSEMAFSHVLLCRSALDAADARAVEHHQSALESLLPKASAQVHRAHDLLLGLATSPTGRGSA